jgi:proteic killer suppression protein
MELSFRTRTLRSTCEDEATTSSSLEPETVERLRRRLADLRAARTVLDLVAGRPSFGGEGKVELRLQIGDGYELYCRPNHRPLPLDEEGSVDWHRVHRLQVMEIEGPS